MSEEKGDYCMFEECNYEGANILHYQIEIKGIMFESWLCPKHDKEADRRLKGEK